MEQKTLDPWLQTLGVTVHVSMPVDPEPIWPDQVWCCECRIVVEQEKACPNCSVVPTPRDCSYCEDEITTQTICQCDDCGDFLCADCMGEENTWSVADWLDIPQECSSCGHALCFDCVNYCHDCHNDPDSTGSVYCWRCLPWDLTSVCNIHDWYTCGQHQYDKEKNGPFKCGECLGNYCGYRKYSY